jgi:hypothetical protein
LIFREEKLVMATVFDLRVAAMTTQVECYEDSKRQETVVYADVYVRKYTIYERIRDVKHPFGRHSITTVRRRVVYGKRRRLFTLIYVP